MKLLATAILAIMPLTAIADGINQAPPKRPDLTPATEWNVVGLGVGIGAIDVLTEGTNCENAASFKVQCEPETEKNSKADGVLFARYLRDQGSLVLGAEVGYFNGQAYAEAQAGYDLGRFLPYAGLGTEGAALGIDYKLTNNWMIGAKAINVDDDPQPQLRLTYIWQY